MDITAVFDGDDIGMTRDFQSYCEKILETPSDFHKITSKEQVEAVITTILSQYSVDFISFEVLLGLIDPLTQFQQYKAINDLAKTLSNQ